MPGTLPGSGPLDTPPPSPDVPGGGVGGSSGSQSSMPTLSGLAAPAPIGAANLPPEILTGMMAAAEKISGMFDSFAQVTPDLASDWDLCKEILQRTLGKVLVAGGGPTSTNAPGSQFAGGGIASGIPQSRPM